MRHGLHFNLDGLNSYDMGIMKVNLSASMFEDLLISNKSIIEEKIDGRDKPYHYGVERDPLSFPLPIYFEENLSSDKIRDILRWLDSDQYRPFYMLDDPNRVWYVMVHNDVSIIHNGIRSGHMTLDLRTDSAYTHTPYALSEVFEFTGNANGQEIEIENKGDFDCLPIIHITKIGDGDITIQNLSNYTGDFTFTDLVSAEEVIVDCENKDIETSSLTHRYNNFSKNYLSLVRGINRIKVFGDCKIQFEMDFRIY